MKRIFVSIFCFIAFQTINAQYVSDGLRYSSGETQGTARFKAMGGAFGALGGDISAISINPASAAIFNRSHGALSASNNNTPVSSISLSIDKEPIFSILSFFSV